MGSIDKYIFRTTLASFVVVLSQPDRGDLDYAGVTRN